MRLVNQVHLVLISRSEWLDCLSAAVPTDSVQFSCATWTNCVKSLLTSSILPSWTSARCWCSLWFAPWPHRTQELPTPSRPISSAISSPSSAGPAGRAAVPSPAAAVPAPSSWAPLPSINGVRCRKSKPSPWRWRKRKRQRCWSRPPCRNSSLSPRPSPSGWLPLRRWPGRWRPPPLRSSRLAPTRKSDWGGSTGKRSQTGSRRLWSDPAFLREFF